METGPRLSEDLAARRAALIFGGTALGWLLIQWVGRGLGWSPPLMLVFDLLALAGFIWGAVLTVRIWRKRRKE
ncbi:DUF5337 family protein [Falsirhodobacter sp. 20TX0035]|uniref:DUF5337 family protein n=1 Tax=Falsirhodobacter sp. 20TX0035 TaxID=3022019 RepID=UPI00232EFE1B|nr:DUF5337 family protein [Falsirhodobacter sp. 20TX0035]MDB6454365.1 DUF5337 family protein [Falsirhodobacter sp. 20TX0035]